MLATRCPLCKTLFKVTSGQLQLHQGQVRCGHCQHVFSGIDHLAAADSDTWDHLNLDQAPSPPPVSFLAEQHAKPSTPWKTVLANTPRYARIGAMALLICLLLQVAWWNRITWIHWVGPPTLSASSPLLSTLFAVPARGALVVEGSGLQPLDENTLRIELTLRNKHALPSHWPHLKVDLLDSQGLLLATKTLGPADYQQRDAKPANELPPISPRQTVEVLAYLNIKHLSAQLPESAITGFRLELFDHSTNTP